MTAEPLIIIPILFVMAMLIAAFVKIHTLSAQVASLDRELNDKVSNLRFDHAVQAQSETTVRFNKLAADLGYRFEYEPAGHKMIKERAYD